MVLFVLFFQQRKYILRFGFQNERGKNANSYIFFMCVYIGRFLILSLISRLSLIILYVLISTYPTSYAARLVLSLIQFIYIIAVFVMTFSVFANFPSDPEELHGPVHLPKEEHVSSLNAHFDTVKNNSLGSLHRHTVLLHKESAVYDSHSSQLFGFGSKQHLIDSNKLEQGIEEAHFGKLASIKWKGT